MGHLAALWGLAGLVLLLSFAILRLTPIAIDTFSVPLGWHHWLALFAFVLFMAWSEGYRGFQKAFSPRAAARAEYLVEHPTPLRMLLAPLFVMGYFDTTLRRRVAAWGLTLAIVVLIVFVHQLEQPWRGIIDAGVVVGLTWGLVTVLWFAARAFADPTFDTSPEVPDQAGPSGG